MSKTEKVISFLTSTLSSAYIKVDEDGQLIAAYPGLKEVPVNISVKTPKGTKSLPIYLPTDEIVKQQNKGKRMIYFPFAENIFNGNSEMLNFTLRALNSRLHGSLVKLVDALLRSAIDTDNVDYGNEVIDVLKGLSIKKTLGRQVIRLVKTANKTKPYGPDSILAIKLTRDVPKGVSHIREAHIRVLDTDKEKLFGDNPTQQIRDLLSDLLTNIFGDVDAREVYNASSGSRMCPSYFAALKSFALIADRINEVASGLGTYKDDTIHINDEWFNDLTKESELEKFHSRYIINKFEGNIGAAKKGDANVIEQKQGNTPMARPTRNFTEAAQPVEMENQVQQQAPAQEQETKESSFNEFLNGLGGGTGVTAPSFSNETQTQQQTSQSVQSNNSTGYNVKPLPPAQPYQQPVQQNVQNSLSANTGFKVLPAQQPSALRKVHVHDARGTPLYWQHGEPYMAEASQETIPNMVWEVDNLGNAMYTNTGEPSLVQINAGQVQGQGGFGHPAQNVGFGHPAQGAPNGNFPTMQELSAMPYTQRIYWEDKIAQSRQAMHGNSYGGGNWSNNTGFSGHDTGFSTQSSNTGFGASGSGFGQQTDTFRL